MIADRIKMLRTAQNMSQSELAKKLDITRSSVNAWEQGFFHPVYELSGGISKTISCFYRLSFGVETECQSGCNGT